MLQFKKVYLERKAVTGKKNTLQTGMCGVNLSYVDFSYLDLQIIVSQLLENWKMQWGWILQQEDDLKENLKTANNYFKK